MLQDELGETAVTGVVSVAADSDEAETQFEVCYSPLVFVISCSSSSACWERAIHVVSNAAERGSVWSSAV